MKRVLNFANNLKILRKSANLTQKQLAESIGVDQRTISAWEKEICEPSFAMLTKLAEFFNETVEDLLYN